MIDQERSRIISELVEEHSLVLYRFAYRLSGSADDAEDLVQQAFMTAQQNLGQVRNPNKVRSWLLTNVRNAFLKSLRKANFARFESFDGVADPSLTESGGAVDGEELQAALNQMPEDYRLPVILFYFQEMSYKQIASHLGVPEGTVMSRLSRGKAYLRQRLVARMGDEAPVQLSVDTSSDAGGTGW